MEFHREVLAAGYPSLMGGQSHAPFDILADTLRGTRGIVMDMYRQPDKLLEAMEKLIPMNIDCGLQMANASGRPIVFFALHKGDDTFMSDKQYEQFYWPTFKRLVLALIERGMTPCIFFEGNFTSRLEYLLEFPKGKILARFDTTDIFKAKEVLRDHTCIEGNVLVAAIQYILIISFSTHEISEFYPLSWLMILFIFIGNLNAIQRLHDTWLDLSEEAREGIDAEKVTSSVKLMDGEMDDSIEWKGEE